MMIIIQLILLNLLWITCVLSAAHNVVWPSIIVFILMSIFVYLYQGIKKVDWYVIAVSLIFAIGIDGVLKGLGWAIYAGTFHPIQYLPPLWIILLWIGFALILRTAMQWLFKKSMPGLLLMGVGAPLSYFSAAKLGAVVFTNMLLASVTIAVGWMLYYLLIQQLLKNPRFLSVGQR